MYLKSLHIENSGPLRQTSFQLPFTQDGTPKPVVLVGGNGSGKTSLLSIVGDALFEAAAAHYADVLPGATPHLRPWFRIIGASTISHGAVGEFSVLEFEHEGTSYLFSEKGGLLPAKDVSARLPESLRPAATWPDEEMHKRFKISDENAHNIFENGVYVFFPSSRAEVPHWLNRDKFPVDDFDLSPIFIKRMRKPIYVEKGLEGFQQWLLSVILDSRVDLGFIPRDRGGPARLGPIGEVGKALANQYVLSIAVRLLQLILDDDQVRFAWLGRHLNYKLGIARGDAVIVPTLDALSAGQSSLLAIFGTLLRYADNQALQGVLDSKSITGICLVDEIDAHMHVDLQYRALPELIRLFPKVQFIVSSHSPLFVLGMEKAFGSDSIVILDMPSGNPVQAEAYTEFGRALDALKDTKAFATEIAELAGTPGKLLVFVEGETDEIYLSTAAELLGRNALLDRVEFSWVGAKDAESGQSFNTGAKALNQAVALFRAKPQLAQRPLLFLYDNDTRKPAEDFDNVHVRCMPLNERNQKRKVGIENILPENVITDDMYTETEKEKAGGDTVTLRSLDKMKLCEFLCKQKRDAADFQGFADVLDIVEGLAEPVEVEPPEEEA